MDVQFYLNSTATNIVVLTIHIVESFQFDLLIRCCISPASNKKVDFQVHDLVSIRIKYRDDCRIFSGYIDKVSNLFDSYYELVLVSGFRLLDGEYFRRCYRNQSVVEIIKSIFQRYQNCQFDFSRIIGSYPLIDYVVQYDESDYSFVRRLMFEHGLCYFYDDNILCFVDALSCLIDYPIHRDSILIWRSHATYGFDSIKLVGDYSVSFKCASDDFRLTSCLFETHLKSQYEADLYLKIRRSTANQSSDFVFASSDTLSLRPCVRLSLSNPLRVITEIYHNFYIERGVIIYQNQFYASNASQMPSLPAIKRPRFLHTQHAIVRFVEEGVYARASIIYLWDAHQVESPYVPIRQYWVGQGYGAIFYPHVNQRVVVGYVNGELTRPIILGPVLDAENALQIGSKDTYLRFQLDTLYFQSSGLFQFQAKQQISLLANMVQLKSTSTSKNNYSASKIDMLSYEVVHFKVGSSHIDLEGESIHINALKIEINC